MPDGAGTRGFDFYDSGTSATQIDSKACATFDDPDDNVCVESGWHNLAV